ncbi:uncharacterized protein K02A2.6-like [Ochlerotatus camptorhynchus]|uniref:uncharacterized protein K02A2.6-like n=1 Tax=Ochlerotatus camptorhynchus TaxID=644619 RepID=UPI0031DAAC17
MDQIAMLLENQNKLFGELVKQMRDQRVQPGEEVAAVALSPNVPLPPPLAIDGDMEENFCFFESNWRNYATAIGMNNWPDADNPKKVSFLLSIVGTPALKKYFNFELTAEDKRTSDTVLEAIKRKVVCTRNVIVDRLEFFTSAQLSTESIDDFVSRLKVLAKPCRFGVLETEMLTFKIVTSSKWPHLKTKMLTMTDITTTKAVDLCRMEEITAKHSQALSLEPRVEVNMLKVSKSRKCKFCGDWHVFKKGSCPAYGKRCKKCSGKNHFERVCRAGKEKSSRRSSRRIKEVKNAGWSTDEDSSNDGCSERSEESEIEGEIGKIFDNSKQGGNVQAEIQLKVDDKWMKIKCELDTGANTSLIGHDWLCKLSGNPNPKLLPSPFKLQAFGGSTIPVLGQVKILCKHKEKKYRLVLQVVGVDHRPLLSLKVCTTLGLVKFCNTVAVVPAQPLQSETEQDMLKVYRIRAEEIVERNSDIFNGYGKMPGKVSLEIDTNVSPVIQQPRRVPIALRAPLKVELDNLEKDNIITREYNHTEWFVTLDEILPELDQAQVFSTVDARKGFWHVELDERSSKLTSFWTPFGRYRWLRLPFGISSAPEIFQTKLQEIIQGLDGVECLADDLLIYGRAYSFD